MTAQRTLPQTARLLSGLRSVPAQPASEDSNYYKVLQKQPLVAKLAAYAQYQATLQNQAKTKSGNMGECNRGKILGTNSSSFN